MSEDENEMDCDGLRKVLFDHVDGLLGREEADAARDHLADCGPCRALQEEVRRNFSALDAWEDEDLPAGAFDRLRGRLPVSGRPGTGLHGGPRPVTEIGTGSPAGAAPAGLAHRGWVRIAVPYAAGLATAAAAAWLLFLPLPGVPGRGVPGVGGTSIAVPIPVKPSGGGPQAAPVAATTVAAPATAAMDAVADGTRPASLRRGERKLEFRDVQDGVLRTVRLPSGVDPASLELIPDPPRFLPDDEGVK